MTSALDELGAEVPALRTAGPPAAGAARRAATPVAGRHPRPRVGRARPRADAVGPGRRPPGRRRRRARPQADEPIDLYVNGTHFATGRLVVVDGTDWAVRIEHVLDNSNRTVNSGMEVARWPESW